MTTNETGDASPGSASSEPSEASPLELVGDGALVDPALDQLGYRPFAQALAKIVARSPSPTGLVLALHGEWGSGKSSVLNFVEHYLAEDPDSDIEIVPFRPWWFSGQNEIALALVKLILDTAWPAETARADRAKKAIGTLLRVGASATASVPFASVGGDALAMLADRVDGPADVEKARAELEDRLKERSGRLLIVVDDVDRLLPEEMAQMFGVMKGFMSLPNVTYLLAYDPNVVYRSLGIHLNATGDQLEIGRSYMEKITQGRFDLPAPYRHSLVAMLKAEVVALAEALEMRCDVDEYRLRRVLGGAAQLLKTPRDVVLVMNGMRTTLPSASEEVEVADFLGLELLRHFEPDLHRLMHHDGDRFRNAAAVALFDGDIERGRLFHQGWLDRARERHPAYGSSYAHGVALIATTLFPSCNEDVPEVDGHRPTPPSVDARIQGVAHPTMHDWYFRLYANPIAFTRSDIREVHGLLETPELLARYLIDRNQEAVGTTSSRADLLLDELTDRSRSMSPEQLEGLFRALAIAGDDLYAPEHVDPPTSDAGHKAKRLATDVIARLPDEQQMPLAMEVIGSSAPLYFALRFVRSYISHFRNRGHPTLESALEKWGHDGVIETFSVTQLIELRDAVSGRLLEAFESGDLQTSRHPAGSIGTLLNWNAASPSLVAAACAQPVVARIVFDHSIDRHADVPVIHPSYVNHILGGETDNFYATIATMFDGDPYREPIRADLLIAFEEAKAEALDEGG